MTAQATEKLYIFDEEYQIQGEPLSKYLELLKDIKLSSPHTGCWRGYIGTWEIKNNKLYLVDFYGYTEDGDVGIDYLFKNKKEVIASWYTGELRVPQGKMIKYIYAGFGSIYEKELIFHIQNGIIKKIKIKDNQTNEINDIQFREYFIESIKHKIQNSDLYELIDMFREEYQRTIDTPYHNFDNSNSHLCVMVDISEWDIEEKNILFESALKGINYATFVLNNCNYFPVGDFNSVIKALNGNSRIFINKKGIKWYPECIKEKLRKQGIVFEDVNNRKKNNFYNNHNSNYDYQTYNEFNGSYAQDVEGLSDQFINDVLDGDPDLYWNID